MRVGVAMIVKNEEAMLARCLESVKQADEIVVCDTGSCDRTIEIARAHTDRVFTDYQWQDSFAEARNHAKSKSTADWILSIDADEILLSDFSDVRRAASLALNAVDCLQIAGDNGTRNLFPRLFRNAPEIQWNPAHRAHNVLNVVGEHVGDVAKDDSLVKIQYDYSPAHYQDPDRTKRMLELSLKENPRNVRAMFYLAREYAYRRMWDDALVLYGRHVQCSDHLAEKAEAFLAMAQIYFKKGMGNDARDACAQALIINPHFKEALLLMADLAGNGRGNPRWQKNANQWLKLAETADNSEVLFVRT